ncbi:MAG TPA: GSU2403 family nucleotidyltransferase fold protein, partial [Xanthobacteraceae bacterium]|nr:GSU2403 family nucleotidyltransferase fold protein [Xanthobacteraceae bacterium]
EIEPSFRAVPNLHSPTTAATYVNAQNYRVELLTDNRGPESDRLTPLPALQTHAQPLRFLDYLLADAIRAAVLWDGGILVNVPQPERYAVHKLIVAERRTASAIAKRQKDLHQASSLFDALAEHRAHDLAAAWKEAYERGPQWRKHLLAALSHLDQLGRDRLLYAIGQRRSIVTGLDVEFRDVPPRYDFLRDVVLVPGGGHRQPDYAISREALDDWFGSEGVGQEPRIKAFRNHRAEIEALAREAYVNEPVPADGAIVITTADVPRLRTRIKSTARRRK